MHRPRRGCQRVGRRPDPRHGHSAQHGPPPGGDAFRPRPVAGPLRGAVSSVPRCLAERHRGVSEDVIAGQREALLDLYRRHVTPGEPYALVDFPDHPMSATARSGWARSLCSTRSARTNRPISRAGTISTKRPSARPVRPVPILIHGGGNLGRHLAASSAFPRISDRTLSPIAGSSSCPVDPLPRRSPSRPVRRTRQRPPGFSPVRPRHGEPRPGPPAFRLPQHTGPRLRLRSGQRRAPRLGGFAAH